MWPWGHLAVAYLCYVASVEIRGEGEQTLPALSALAIGSQFPDIIDKPLAWSLNLLPSGRSLAHSLLTAVLVVWLASWLGRRWHREELAFAFVVGHLVHVLTDLGPGVVVGLVQGDLSQLQWGTYLLWPLFPPPPYQNDSSFVEVFTAFAFDPYVLAQFVLFGIAAGVWIETGATGVYELRRHVRRQLGYES